MTKNKGKMMTIVVPKQPKSKKNSAKGKPKANLSSAMVLRSKPTPVLRSGREMTMARKSTIPQFIIAQIDPFCQDAFGVKVPDEATMDSAVAFSRDLYSLSTPTTFAGTGIVIRFDPGAASVPLVPLSSTTWTQPTYAQSAPVSNQVVLNNTFGLVRTVAYGLKIETRLSAFTAAGFLHIALIPEALQGSTTFVYPTSVAAMEYAPYYKRIPIADLIEDEITVCGKYTDPGTAFRYLAPGFADIAAAYNAGFGSSGWSAIMVWVEAPAVTTANVVDIEVLHHYEALPSVTGTTGIIDATKAAPHSPAIMAATSFVTDRIDPVQVNREDEENKGTFWDYAAKLFPIGLKVAAGIFPVLSPIASAFDAMRL